MAWSLVKSKKHLKKWNQCSHTLSMQGARVAKKGKVGQGPRQAAKAWVCTFGLHQRSCLLDKRLWKEVYHPTSRKMIMHLQFSREKGLGDIHQAADSSPAPLRDHRWVYSQSVNGRGMTLLLIVSRTCHHKKRRTFEPYLALLQVLHVEGGHRKISQQHACLSHWKATTKSESKIPSSTMKQKQRIDPRKADVLSRYSHFLIFFLLKIKLKKYLSPPKFYIFYMYLGFIK